LKVIVIGAGAWGQNICKTLKSLGALAAIVDADEARRATLTETFEVPVYGSWDEVPAGTAEAVAIATPAPAHYEVALQTLRAGLPTFVEKPVTLSAQEAEHLADEAEKAGVTLMVGHLLLFQPAAAFLKEQIENGSLGELRSIHVRRASLGRARNVENVLWSLGVHDVAVVLNLIGAEPTQVLATGDAFLNPGIEDDTHVHMTFPGGVKAHIHNSWLWPTRERSTLVIGSKGMLFYDEIAQTVTRHKKWIDANLANQDEGEELAFEGAAAPLTLEMEEFLRCAATGEASRSSGRSAITVVRVLEDASKLLS